MLGTNTVTKNTGKLCPPDFTLKFPPMVEAMGVQRSYGHSQKNTLIWTWSCAQALLLTWASVYRVTQSVSKQYQRTITAAAAVRMNKGGEDSLHSYHLHQIIQFWWATALSIFFLAECVLLLQQSIFIVPCTWITVNILVVIVWLLPSTRYFAHISITPWSWYARISSFCHPKWCISRTAVGERRVRRGNREERSWKWGT